MVLNTTKNIISGAVLLAFSLNAHAFDSLNSFFGINFGSAYASQNKPISSFKEGDFYELSKEEVAEKNQHFSSYFIYSTPKSGLINGITAAEGYKTVEECSTALKTKVLPEFEEKYGKSLVVSDTAYSIPDKDEPSRTLNLMCNQNTMLISVQDYDLTLQAVKEYWELHPEEAKKAAEEQPSS